MLFRAWYRRFGSNLKRQKDIIKCFTLFYRLDHRMDHPHKRHLIICRLSLYNRGFCLPIWRGFLARPMDTVLRLRKPLIRNPYDNLFVFSDDRRFHIICFDYVGIHCYGYLPYQRNKQSKKMQFDCHFKSSNLLILLHSEILFVWSRW